MPRMQTRNPFLDEFAKLGEQAMGLAQAAGDEARSVFRAQGERWAAELDLVRRDEMDAALAAQRAEFEARLAALESRLAGSAASHASASAE
jgi:BMFP domain-containing protein YqiC